MSTSRASDSTADRANEVRVGEALNDFLDRRARGEAVSESELLARHPDLADELRAHLDLLQDLSPQPAGIDQLLAAGVLQPSDDPAYVARLGSYGVLGVIGRGGMGIVLQAHEASLDRRVALKLLRPELANDRAALARFQREAKAAAALRHPNIVTVHAVGEDRGTHFIAMEYVDGSTLGEVVRETGPMRADRVRELFGQILTGLVAAHDAGLVHRDIKSSNILLDGPDQRVKIADFGLARILSLQTRMTVPESVFGTPEYMSPEQARGENGIDHRSDLYSAGVVLFEMLVGHTPFRAESPSAVVHKILYEAPPDPRRLVVGVDAGLTGLAARLLAKRPEDRPASAAEALSLLAGGGRVRSPERSRARRRMALSGLAVVALVAVVAWLGSRMQGRLDRSGRPGATPAGEIARVWVEKVGGKETTRILATYGNDPTQRIFHTFPKEADYVGDVALVEVGGHIGRIVVAGINSPLDGKTLFAFDQRTTELWSKDLSDGREWPDCDGRANWQTKHIYGADLDDQPGEEIIVISTEEFCYQSRLSIHSADGTERFGSFWHTGSISGLFVQKGFFDDGHPAIIAWGLNNKLDGFNDALRPGEVAHANWDIVPVVMILDPQRMAGLGPPSNDRVDWLPAAPVVAYAFLDMPYGRGAKQVQWNVATGERSGEALAEDAPWDKFGNITRIEPSTVRSATAEPLFRVVLHGVDRMNNSRARTMLVVDRQLRLHNLQEVNTGGDPCVTMKCWDPLWKPIIQNGEYVDR